MSFTDGHCDTCGTPIGCGDCGGCIAYSSVVAQSDPDDGQERCQECGKDYEDFSDIGCWRCDQRSPDFGVLP